MSLNAMSNLTTENGNLPKITHPQGREIIKLVSRMDERAAEMRQKEQVMVKSGDFSQQYITKSVGNLNVDFAQFAAGALGDILRDKGLLEKMSTAVFQEIGAAEDEAMTLWNGKTDVNGVNLMVNALPHKMGDFRNVEGFKGYYQKSDANTKRAIQLVGFNLAKKQFPGDPNLGSLRRLLKDDERGAMDTPRLAAAELGREEFYFIFAYVDAAFGRHKNALQFGEELDYSTRLRKLAPPARQFDSVDLKWLDVENEWF